jgi:preprotein translocase subunit SecY
VIILVAIILTVLVTFVDLGERRIPLQISKQVKGRRIYGGQSTHMSLKVVSVGVLPLIFAYSFLAFPGTIIQLIGGTSSGAYIWWATYMNTGSVLYMVISALLIVAFTFFYSSISFDAKKQAEQLVMQGAVIPGQRGKNIRQYLQTTTNRLNLFAALFLAVLATAPTLLTLALRVQLPFAASSMLIAVSVVLETKRQLDDLLVSRNYDSIS